MSSPIKDKLAPSSMNLTVDTALANEARPPVRLASLISSLLEGDSSPRTPRTPPARLEPLAKRARTAPPEMPLLDFSAILPDPVGFGRLTRQEEKKQKCPDTPVAPMRDEDIEKWKNTHFMKSHRALETVLANRRGALHLASGETVRIRDVEFLSKEGCHSMVYSCVVDGIGECVLKYPRPIKTQTKVAFNRTMNQRKLYRESINHPDFRNHIAPHYNFDEMNRVDGFLLVKRIRGEFHKPLDNDERIDRTDPLWLQLRALCVACQETKIYHDIRIDNIGVENGRIQIFDLKEDLHGDDEILHLRDSVKSFTSNEEDLDWLMGVPTSSSSLSQGVAP